MASLVAVALPIGASGQSTEAELAARVDALVPLVVEARAEADAVAAELDLRARLRAAIEGGVDTLLVRGMTVITPSPDSELARDLFEAAWTRYYLEVESDALRDWTFTFQSGEKSVDIYVDPDAQSRSIEMRWWQSQDDVVRILGAAIGNAVLQDIDGTTVGRWTTADPFRDLDPGALYREFALTASASVRECLSGEGDACLVSLDLGPSAPTLDAWYTPEERRRLVGSGDFRVTRENQSERDECLEVAEYTTCDALLRASAKTWAPLSSGARASLLGFAIDRGGEGAWRRLSERGDASVEEALAFTSGIALESLIAEWRQWIVEGRPDPYGGLLGSSALTGLWILLFAGLAMRSTRWRLA
jgi:hypothetical protein